jgi:hypothetical protein
MSKPKLLLVDSNLPEAEGEEEEFDFKSSQMSKIQSEI